MNENLLRPDDRSVIGLERWDGRPPSVEPAYHFRPASKGFESGFKDQRSVRVGVTAQDHSAREFTLDSTTADPESSDPITDTETGPAGLDGADDIDRLFASLPHVGVSRLPEDE